MPWRGPEYPGEFPTLGFEFLDFCERYLIVPDGPAAGQPLIFYDEQARFALRYYALEPSFAGPIILGKTFRNARRVRRAVFSRPKGYGKSPMLAAFMLFEGLGGAVFDGWDADGEPVGRPWTSLGFKAKVQLLAAAEDQTANTWDPLLEMARNGNLAEDFDIEPLEGFVNIPRGRIEYATSAALTREGFRPVFGAFDQTESWTPTNGGVRLAAAARRNLAKVQGSSIEAPNAYRPGEGSVAERSYTAYQLQQERRLRTADGGILLDHQEMPADTDPEDPESLRRGLVIAYGDAAAENGGHVNLDRIVEDYYDPDTDPLDARLFYGNQITVAVGAWLSQPEWSACKMPGRGTAADLVGSQEPIVLGFDGSRARRRGVTDATALIGCRVRDGHLFQIHVWEQPTGDAGRNWRVPVEQVLATVDDAFKRYNVVGFYADPAKWETHVAAWEARYGARLPVKSTRQNPIEWWMTGGRSTAVVRALDAFEDAIKSAERLPDGTWRGDLSHDGSSELTRHALNAYERRTPAGRQIGKEHPDSPRKIDALVAAVLAYQCRLDALAAGVLRQQSSGFYLPKNVRKAATG